MFLICFMNCIFFLHFIEVVNLDFFNLIPKAEIALISKEMHVLGSGTTMCSWHISLCCGHLAGKFRSGKQPLEGTCLGLGSEGSLSKNLRQFRTQMIRNVGTRQNRESTGMGKMCTLAGLNQLAKTMGIAKIETGNTCPYAEMRFSLSEHKSLLR